MADIDELNWHWAFSLNDRGTEGYAAVTYADAKAMRDKLLAALEESRKRAEDAEKQLADLREDKRESWTFENEEEVVNLREQLATLQAQESAAEAWERAIKHAAHQASWFSGRPGARVHPDIPWDKMNESAKTAAHSTAQQIAMEIAELPYTPPAVEEEDK